MTWVLWVMVPMVHTPRGRSGATFVKALGQIEYGQFCHFCICGPNWDRHHAEWHGDFWQPRAWESLLDSWWIHVWNGGSDLQAGVEIYYWEHTEFWLISGSQNDPNLGPQFPPSVWSIGGPISLSP